MKKLLLMAVVPLVLFTSCRGIFGKRVRGDGDIQTATRSIGSFNSVDVSGAIDLYVRQDSVPADVKIETDKNLLSYVDIFTEGSKLVIRNKDGFNLKPSKGIKVYVSSASYRKLEASGACDIYSENKINSSEQLDIELSGSSDAKLDLSAPKVTADLSGACTITLKGETKAFSVEGSGSTDIKCMELLSEDTDVDISGAGDAEVYASEKLNVDVSGAASVKYKGNASVSQKVSGAGSVKKVD
jgi:hypothetical protein